jgi:hypothetical protein
MDLIPSYSKNLCSYMYHNTGYVGVHTHDRKGHIHHRELGYTRKISTQKTYPPKFHVAGTIIILFFGGSYPWHGCKDHIYSP